MRACWMLGVVLGCGHGRPPTVSSAAPGPLTFSPWDGVYVPRSIGGGGSRTPALLARTLTDGLSVTIGGSDARATRASSDGSWRFQLTEGRQTYALLLNPPEHAGLPWHVRIDGMDVDYEQHVEPLEARVRARLVVGTRFARLDWTKLGSAGPLDDALTRDSITVMDRGLVRMQLPDGNGTCSIDVLIPTLDRAHEPLPSPLPAEGILGSVTYTLGKLDEGCRGRSLDVEARGVGGGIRLFADRTGWIAGLLATGHGDSETFVAPHVSRIDLERLVRAANDVPQDETEHRTE